MFLSLVEILPISSIQLGLDKKLYQLSNTVYTSLCYGDNFKNATVELRTSIMVASWHGKRYDFNSEESKYKIKTIIQERVRARTK